MVVKQLWQRNKYYSNVLIGFIGNVPCFVGNQKRHISFVFGADLLGKIYICVIQIAFCISDEDHFLSQKSQQIAQAMFAVYDTQHVVNSNLERIKFGEGKITGDLFSNCKSHSLLILGNFNLQIEGNYGLLQASEDSSKPKRQCVERKVRHIN